MYIHICMYVCCMYVCMCMNSGATASSAWQVRSLKAKLTDDENSIPARIKQGSPSRKQKLRVLLSQYFVVQKLMHM